MGSQIIEYSYAGDEDVWRAAIEKFLAAIAADATLKGSFSYHVFIKVDGVSRVHVPVWAGEAVLAHLTAQPFFAEFAAAVKQFAGGELTVTKPVLATG